MLLEENKVEYLIIGGYAMAFHGYPRFTKDIDIFFHNSDNNIKKLKKSLIGFGFPESTLPDPMFTEKGNIIQFGITPLRVDILNEIDGVDFMDAFENCIRGKYGDIEVNFISQLDLIKNKKASGRDQDILDVKKLERKDKK
jgi:hypothetical protein